MWEHLVVYKITENPEPRPAPPALGMCSFPHTTCDWYHVLRRCPQVHCLSSSPSLRQLKNHSSSLGGMSLPSCWISWSSSLQADHLLHISTQHTAVGRREQKGRGWSESGVGICGSKGDLLCLQRLGQPTWGLFLTQLHCCCPSLTRKAQASRSAPNASQPFSSVWLQDSDLL